MKSIEEIQTLVNEFIDGLKYEREPKSLYDPIEYVLACGGKRMRPTLMLAAYNLYKDNPEAILWTASGLETYHNYTLLHDDLMDKADVRRGRPTVHKKWDDNKAILSGDTMFVLAYERISMCPEEKLRKVLSCFTETALEISEGQEYDMQFETRQDVTEDEYIEMIRLKTSVLLACATRIGAILADASIEDQDNLYHFAERFGLAFQLQDDYLDVYGDEKVFGKAIGGDICNNKKTFMLIHAQLLAEGKDKEDLDRWLTAKEFNRSEKVSAVTALYNKLGIDQLAKQKMEQYYKEALCYLDKVSVPAEKKQILTNYITDLLHREK